MKKTLFTLCSLAIIGLSSCGSNAPKKIKNWKEYSNENVSIQYPDTWTMDESGAMSTEFVIKSPVSSAMDDFQENINLVFEDLTGRGIDLDAYIDVSQEQLKGLALEGSTIDSKRLEFNGAPVHRFIYPAEMQGYELMIEQYCWMKNEVAYILTFSAEHEEYEENKATARKIVESFNIK